MLHRLARLAAALVVLAVLSVSDVTVAAEVPAAADPALAAAETPEDDAPSADAASLETDAAPEHAEEDASGGSGGFLDYDEPTRSSRSSFGSLMLRLVLSMAIILGLIYGVLMLVRKLARKAKALPKSEKLIRIIDRAMLDQKRAIYLVKVVDRLLVVGAGASELRTLAQIEDKTVVENVQDVEFTDHLKSLLGRLAGGGS